MIEISVLLGVLQGLTEFLPISSSGHLVLLEKVFNFEAPGLLFEALVHFGTVGSVLFIFRRRIWYLIKSPLSGGENLKLLFFLAVATIPIGVIGIVCERWIEIAFDHLPIVGFSLLFTGTLLYLVEKVERKERKLDEMNFLDSICIGIMQVFSLLPGISRSGVTITSGVFRGLDRPLAAEFSFILSIPTIMGATLLKLMEAFQNPAIHRPFLNIYILATVVSFLTGIVAIKTLLSIIQKRRLDLFAYYCGGVGISTLIYFYFLS